MNRFALLIESLKGLSHAFSRYPVTALFLVAAAITNAININNYTDNYISYIATFAIGAFLGIVAQAAYERFFNEDRYRYLLYGTAALLTGGYYLIIKTAPGFSPEIGLRTMVAIFTLLIAYLLIPSINNNVLFNHSFMITFKSFFIALFFSIVIFLGTTIVIGAIDQLLFRVSYRYFAHTANIVFIMFAPLYFLSLIPQYHRRPVHEIEEDASVPKLLAILLSYIIIPLTAAFTVIMIVYIMINIRSEFWTDSLLEPMLVSYSIVVILLYILTSSIENKFTIFFKRVFPKILVPLVIFQVISSVLSTGDTGITLGRYFTVMYGVFAAISGIIFSIMPVRKNHWVAILLIFFSLISIMPPMDAFTVSRNSQIRLVENVLINNQMLDSNAVIPNAEISTEDKEKIISGMRELQILGYIERVPWLPEDFNYYRDFEEVFGFREFIISDYDRDFLFINLNLQEPLAVSGYDFFWPDYRVSNTEATENVIVSFTKDQIPYTLSESRNRLGEVTLLLRDNSGTDILQFDTQQVFTAFVYKDDINQTISLEEATFSTENDMAILTAVVRDLFIDRSERQIRQNAGMHLLIKIK